MAEELYDRVLRGALLTAAIAGTVTLIASLIFIGF